MRVRRFGTVAGVAAALAFGAAFIACGGDDDNDEPTPAATMARPTTAATTSAPTAAATTAAPTAAATTAAQTPAGGQTPAAGGPIAVSAADFSFSPGEFTVPAASPVTVTLNNTGSFPHTLSVYEDEDFTTPVAGADTGSVAGGASGDFTATFAEAKEYYFRCEIHPGQMTGEIAAQ